MISTVTRAVSAASTAGATSFALIIVFMLLGCLITKQVISASEDSQLDRLNQSLNVVVLPLLMVFAAIAVAEVLSVLG